MGSRNTAGSNVIASLSILIALSMVACGGDDSNDGKGAAGSDGSGAGNEVPESCSAPADCPSGYACVPKGPVPTMTVVDMDCLNACNGTCELAGPVKDMCLKSCMDSCKSEEPVAGTKVEGTCEPSDSGGGNMGGAGGGGGASGNGNGNAGAGGSNTKSFVWSGAWTADVSHTSKCNFSSSAMQMGNQSYTVTINATGENSAPKATISGGFALEGTGSSAHVSLTGDFPFRSWKGEVAKTNSLNSPNNATLKITKVESASKASGTIEGSWDASGGWTCKTEAGTITLTR